MKPQVNCVECQVYVWQRCSQLWPFQLWFFALCGLEIPLNLLYCWFTCILPTTPPWFTCSPSSTSPLCKRVLRTLSGSRGCALQTVSHWFVCTRRTTSRRFTCVWLMLRRGAPVGRNGDTWLPGEFLAPSSWRRRSSGRTGRKRPKRSEGVNKSEE